MTKGIGVTNLSNRVSVSVTSDADNALPPNQFLRFFFEKDGLRVAIIDEHGIVAEHKASYAVIWHGVTLVHRRHMEELDVE